MLIDQIECNLCIFSPAKIYFETLINFRYHKKWFKDEDGQTLDKLTTNCQPISSVLFLLSYDVQHFEILHHKYKLGLERKILQKV